MKTQLFLLTILFLTSCSIFEDYDARTYYKVTGTGYVYNAETKEPEPYAIISVWCVFETRNIGQLQPLEEEYLADKNGFFYIKFLKRTNKCDITGYTIKAWKSNNYDYSSKIFTVSPEYVKKYKSNTINLDTLWIRKTPY